MASNGGRRSRGEGSIYWDEKRQRFLAGVTVGYTPDGKRIMRRGSGKTEAAARAKLKEVVREYEAGLTAKARNQTVRHAVEDWLVYGLHGRAQRTVDKYRILCQTHIISALGARKLRELTATDVDRWLAEKAKTLSTRTLRELHQCLNRSINRAMARDLVARNVVALCGVPRGRLGRPSKSLGLRSGQRPAPSSPGHGSLPRLRHRVTADRGQDRGTAALTGALDPGPTTSGAPRPAPSDGRRLRRALRRVVAQAGLNPAWTPRELRHSFVSLLSDHGVPIEKIADLVGHSGTTVTEKVYRHQLARFC